MSRPTVNNEPQTIVYVLLVDDDGTTRSTEGPFGVAVTTLTEAKRFAQEGKVGYSHSYMKLRVFDSKDAALDHAFPERKRPQEPTLRTETLPTAAELIARELGESNAP